MVRAAAGSGVGHIVALSGLDADLASPFCHAVTNGRWRDGGCAFSIARASILTELFMRRLTEARSSGQIRPRAAYVESTPAGYVAEMTGADEDPWWMYAFPTMFDSVRERRWAAVSGEVLGLTGRRPESVRDVLTRRGTRARGSAAGRTSPAAPGRPR